jgi:hypothetical protein
MVRAPGAKASKPRRESASTPADQGTGMHRGRDQRVYDPAPVYAPPPAVSTVTPAWTARSNIRQDATSSGATGYRRLTVYMGLDSQPSTAAPGGRPSHWTAIHVGVTAGPLACGAHPSVPLDGRAGRRSHDRRLEFGSEPLPGSGQTSLAVLKRPPGRVGSREVSLAAAVAKLHRSTTPGSGRATRETDRDRSPAGPAPARSLPRSRAARCRALATSPCARG